MAREIRGPDNDVFYGLRGEDVLPEHIRADAAARGQQKKAGFAASLFGILALASFLAVFVLGFVGSDILPDGMEWLTIAAFGCTFFFFGCFMAASGVLFGLLFSVVGAAIAGISAAYGLGSDAVRMFLMDTAVPAALCSVFIIAGVLFLTVPGRVAKKKERIYTAEVSARVVKKDMRLSRDSDGHRHRTWVLTWEYSYGGRSYVWKSNTGRRPEPRDIGDPGVLYLDPSNPDDVWEKPDKAEKMMFRIVGAVFLAVGTISLLLVTGALK